MEKDFEVKNKYQKVLSPLKATQRVSCKRAPAREAQKFIRLLDALRARMLRSASPKRVIIRLRIRRCCGGDGSYICKTGPLTHE